MELLLRTCFSISLRNVEVIFSLYSLNYSKLQVRLAPSKDARWEEKEAAILALGAVAEGCISGLLPHLAQVGYL
jgi:transportin-1